MPKPASLSPHPTVARLLSPLLVGLLWLSLGACSGADQGEGASCVRDQDCPQGVCIKGACVLPGEDDAGSATGKDGGGQGSLFDTVGAADGLAPNEGDTAGDGGPGTDGQGGQDTSGGGTDATLPPPDGLPADLPVEVDPKEPPQILVDPESYTFSYIEGQGAVLGKDVVITNMGQGPLVVFDVHWAPGVSASYGLYQLPSFPLVLGPYEQVSFQVGFQEVGGGGQATLLIQSNDPDRPEVQVHFTAAAKIDRPDPTACIQVFPTSLNFGQVVRGDVKELTFNIKSCDAQTPLVVSAIQRGQGGFLQPTLSDEFQIVNPPSWPLTIPPGGLETITVSYTPGLAGLDSGYWIVKNTDPDDGEVKVQVNGRGVPPPLDEIGLHVEMEWDTSGTDVDAHLLMPGGAYFTCPDDCYYGNPNPDWGTQGDYVDDAFLDYDDTDGYGPENINVEDPKPGTYRVIMHYFRDTDDSEMSVESQVTVRILIFGQLVASFGPTTLDRTNATWEVCDVDMPSGTVTPLGNVYPYSGFTGSCAFPF